MQAPLLAITTRPAMERRRDNHGTGSVRTTHLAVRLYLAMLAAGFVVLCMTLISLVL